MYVHTEIPETVVLRASSVISAVLMLVVLMTVGFVSLTLKVTS